jgi:hypothetical protein
MLVQCEERKGWLSQMDGGLLCVALCNCVVCPEAGVWAVWQPGLHLARRGPGALHAVRTELLTRSWPGHLHTSNGQAQYGYV